MSNTITAYFKGRVGVAESVYQNDYGIVMAFDSIDLPAHFDCYFSRLNQEEALPGLGADNRVTIPNSILANPGNVTIHIPLHTGEDDSEVEYVIYFKVIGRARPIDDGTPAQMTAIERALALLSQPITNIEEIVNEALSFTGDTFDEMKAELQEDFDNYTETLEGDLATWKGGVESDIDDVEHDFTVLQNQFDTAVAAVSTDTELTDIRVGDDEVTYTTAGLAVRTQFANLKSELEAAYEKTETMTLYSGIYLTGATSVGSVYTPTFNASVGYYFAIIEVVKGDYLTITGKGGNASRLWTFTDTSGNVINVAGINVDVQNETVLATTDGYVYVSISPNGTYTPLVVKHFGTGHQLSRLSSTYYDYAEQTLTKGKYYSINNLTIGTVAAPVLTVNSGLDCVEFSCQVGDVFKITGKGGTAGRLYVITDSAGRILEVASAEQEDTDRIISIATSGTLYVNVRNTVPYKIEKLTGLEHNVVSYVGNNYVALNDYFTEHDGIINHTGYYQGTNTVGQLFNPSFVWSRSWANAYCKVYKGDVFTITCTGGQNIRAYLVTDTDGYVIKVSAENATLSDYKLHIEQDGYLYCAFNTSYTYSLTYTRQLQNDVSALNDDINIITNGAKIVSPSFLYDKDIPNSNYVVESVTYDPTEYMSLEAIYAGYDALVTAYPSYVSKTLLGKDQSDTYNIYKYEFKPSIPTIQGTLEEGENYTADSYPVIILDACTHGSERPCAMALLNVMTKICNAIDDNGLMGWFRSNIHFVVVPIVNPWGYVNYDRRNSRGVDLNRNYIPFWRLGESDSTSWWYRGESELSEKETQYVYNILDTYKNKAIFYYSYHTFGESAQGWEHLSCYFYGPLEEQKLQRIGINLIDEITKSGWANHNLPTNSGYIGLLQNANVILNGNATQQGSALGIPSVCPEVLHRYYDGSSGSVYNTDLNTINAEWMIRSIALACKTFL